MTEKKKVSRRKFIAGAGGVVVVAAAAAAGYYATLPKPTTMAGNLTSTQGTTMQTSGPTAKPALRVYSNSLYDSNALFAEWKQLYNQDIDFTNIDFSVLTDKVLATGGDGWDAASVLNAKPLVAANVYAPIPVQKLTRWDPAHIYPAITNPEAYFAAATAQRFSASTWIQEGVTLAWVPFLYGMDTVAYLPEFVPYEEHGSKATTLSISELWNPEWKGKTALFPWYNEDFGFVANYLQLNGQMTLSSYPGNLSKAELDQVYNYLLPIVKSGQFKVFWSDYGSAVTLLSTKEIYLTTCIEPIVFDVRAAGTPTYYANLKEGPMLWMNGQVISPHANPDVLEDAYSYVDFKLTAWYALELARTGYMSTTYGYDDVKQGMGEEYYGWFYGGAATFEPLGQVMKDIWPDRQDFWTLPARIQNALFLPSVYFKPGAPSRTGSPDPNGNVRDIGSTEDKAKAAKWFAAPDWPDNMDYYVSRFEDLKANLPAT
ncbi:MAG: extracellular solute-binding protein [Candidatus Bathyarchaeia archaeon]